MNETLKKNLSKPKVVKKKKVVIDYVTTVFEEKKNYRAPNSTSYYFLPKATQMSMLNDYRHTKTLINHITNLSTFYSRSPFYSYNSITNISEYFCNFFGYDGILPKVQPATCANFRLSNISSTELNVYYYPENMLFDPDMYQPELSSCKTMLAGIHVLGLIKQYERDALFLNGINSSPYTAYLCYLNIMFSTLDKYYSDKGLKYQPTEENNLLNFDTYSLIVDVLDHYLETTAKRLSFQNLRTLINTILIQYYNFTLGPNKFEYSADELMSFCKTIRNDYVKHFHHNPLAKQIVQAFDSYTPRSIEEIVLQKQQHMAKFCDKYSKWYIDTSGNFLPTPLSSLLVDIVRINGYSYSTYLTDAFIMYHCSINLGLLYYAYLYNSHVEYNKLDICTLIYEYQRAALENRKFPKLT